MTESTHTALMLCAFFWSFYEMKGFLKQINYGLQHKVGDPTNPLSPLKGEMSRSDRGVNQVCTNSVKCTCQQKLDT